MPNAILPQSARRWLQGECALVTRPLTWGTAMRLVTGILASPLVLGPRSTQPAEATV